ncbi:hypothetical protein FDP41_002865 [Naegleria fowleri]|uniref:RRM domain-containing protein n=1 Tax=Naegleria fowleri TaxID=5763 RepID=A0A6A5BXL8_NAEFO|nr:uncharacterized protein FDP41_002865 [Naegleria fowleri]KAF0978350.1 hypothetical protein FDP41_002865 [Naegleria fowleri]CAG4719134.1 unnamed protein product [Naegleria fowleri]
MSTTQTIHYGGSASSSSRGGDKDFNMDEFIFDEPEVTLNEDVSNVVIIDGLPIIEQAKEEALKSKVLQIVEKKGEAKVLNFYIPYDSNGKSKGMAFVEVESAEQAKKVIAGVEGFQFSKFTLHGISAADVDKYSKFDENTYLQQQKQQHSKQYKERDNLVSWLKDEKARSQYALSYEDMVDICWNDPLHLKEIVYSKEKWSDGDIDFSPLGSYLVTYHEQGAALWGGPQFTLQDSLSHKKVTSVQFSPKESFAVTVSELPGRASLWDLRAQRKGLSIQLKGNLRGPVFKWSADEKYFARLGEDCIHIFDSSTMELLGGKPYLVPGVRDFAFNPEGKSFLIYSAVNESNGEGTVSLVDVGRIVKDLKSKPYYNVTDIKLRWQQAGDYIAIAVSRESTVSTEKVTTTTFDIMRVNQKNFPIESVTDFNDCVDDFEFEPVGDTLAIIHGPGNVKKSFSLYTFKGATNKLIKKAENKTINRMFWSPRGHDLVLANTKLVSVTLEFWNADEGELIGTGEHFAMTDACWDPSGRYFASYVSAERRSNDNGFIIWTFLGKIMHQAHVDKLHSFKWRPRIPSLLTNAMEKEVKKRLPQKKVEIETKQLEAARAMRDEKLRKRKKAWDEFEEVMARLKIQYEKMKPELIALKGYDPDEYNMEEVEEVIETTEEVVE